MSIRLTLESLLQLKSTYRGLLPGNSELYYIPSLFNEAATDGYYKSLLENIDWQHDKIKMFGMWHLQPRLTAWYGDVAYTYSGITMQPKGWTPELLKIKSAIEQQTDQVYNSVLVNLYRDGKDYMGWHRDNDKPLGVNPNIASVSVSFGAVRSFQIREYKTKENKINIELDSGSLLVMAGDTQHTHEHQVPKRLKVTEPRMNLTFRRIYSAFS